MKVTKSYIKQLVKEELNRVLNETTNTMANTGDIARKTFFGDSANSFMKLVLDKRKEHLATMQGTYNEKDLMIISKEFMPAFREAIAASWDMYPSQRLQAENTSDKQYNKDGSDFAETTRNAVSKHFMKELSGRTLAKLSNNSNIISFMFHMLED
jgi:YesN/AraC family two-component response regulator